MVIYRVPETVENDLNTRKQLDNSKVEEVVQALGLSSKPAKIARIGKYNPPAENQAPKSRPLRVSFETHEEAKDIIDNCQKLKDAPAHIKGYSISFDASTVERQHINSLVAEAKEKTKNDPDYVHKVRGPPWQPFIKPIKRKAAPQPAE